MRAKDLLLAVGYFVVLGFVWYYPLDVQQQPAVPKRVCTPVNPIGGAKNADRDAATSSLGGGLTTDTPVETAVRKGDKTTDHGEASSSAATIDGLLDGVEPIQTTSDISALVIEVGTGKKPDFLSYTKRNNSFYFVGVEPVETAIASLRCLKKLRGRSTVFPFAIGPKNTRTEMNVGFVTVCSSLLPLPGKEKECNSKVRSLSVRVISLDTLFERLLPKHLDVKLLALDMQGYDLYGASSLRKQEYRERVGNLMLECQDLPQGDSKLISPGALTCGEAQTCIEEHWKFTFVGCWPNMNVREYNCIYLNPRNPLADELIRPTFNRNKPREGILHPALCPAYFSSP